ncbi:MAG: hypothetical protein MI861_26910, partial [Pirellulales bacterium]|nr:hypothetical protein [Pirellulales bacterium]
MNSKSNPEPSDMVTAELRDWGRDRPDAETDLHLCEVIRQSWVELSQPAVPSTRSDRPGRRRVLWLVSSACAAVAATIVVVLVVVNANRTVYAQALTAVQSADSVHAVCQRFDETGRLQEDRAEIWYDAQRGVRELSIRKGLRTVRLDDGTHQWLYRQGPQTVVKSSSGDPIGELREMLEPLRELERHQAKREPALDLVIGDDACQAHVVQRNSKEISIRWVSWIAPGGRLLRHEEQLWRDGDWQVDERVELRYDVSIAADRFVADFAAARLIDRTNPSAPLTLADSMATAERLGIILGIHDVRRVEGDCVFVMSTCRASEEVIRRFGRIDSRRDGSRVYGNFTWSS